MVNLSAPDLTQHPPRSVRVRLGGYAHLSRLLDKARAHLAGKAGEYHYNCPLDQRFFAFTGIDQEKMLAEIKTGKTDVQMLEWVIVVIPFAVLGLLCAIKIWHDLPEATRRYNKSLEEKDPPLVL